MQARSVKTGIYILYLECCLSLWENYPPNCPHWRSEMIPDTEMSSPQWKWGGSGARSGSVLLPRLECMGRGTGGCLYSWKGPCLAWCWMWQGSQSVEPQLLPGHREGSLELQAREPCPGRGQMEFSNFQFNPYTAEYQPTLTWYFDYFVTTATHQVGGLISFHLWGSGKSRNYLFEITELTCGSGSSGGHVSSVLSCCCTSLVGFLHQTCCQTFSLRPCSLHGTECPSHHYRPMCADFN